MFGLHVVAVMALFLSGIVPAGMAILAQQALARGQAIVHRAIIVIVGGYLLAGGIWALALNYARWINGAF